MANNAPETPDMFGFNNRIKAIVINSPTLKGGNLSADLTAVTECPDVSMLTPADWLPAVMAWAVRLANGQEFALKMELHPALLEYWEARAEQQARRLDDEIGFARVKDDQEMARRSEMLAAKIMEITGIKLFPGEIEEWSDDQRQEVRKYLGACIAHDQGGNLAHPAMPSALAYPAQQVAQEIGEAAAEAKAA